MQLLRRASTSVLARAGEIPKALGVVEYMKQEVALTAIGEQLDDEAKAAENIGECVHIAYAGDGFGDLAFLSGKPRALTARAHMPTQLISIKREAYERLVAAQAQLELRKKIELVPRKEDQKQAGSSSSSSIANASAAVVNCAARRVRAPSTVRSSGSKKCSTCKSSAR